MAGVNTPVSHLDPYNQNTVMPANTKDLMISPGAIVTLTNVPINSFGYR